MSDNLTDWQGLDFAIEVNPDGIRRTTFRAATAARSSAVSGNAGDGGALPSADNSPETAPTVVSPTLLGMAASVTKSMVTFAASGFKTVDEQTHQTRVAQCTGCQYYHGSRCQVCGCFSDKKAWLPHEDCPLGKWPA